MAGSVNRSYEIEFMETAYMHPEIIPIGGKLSARTLKYQAKRHLNTET
jgi:hypothetical protein